jgi:Tfp pilus assembly protein PilV
VSLLEAVVATVILALVGIACLEGTQRALVLQQRAEQRAMALQQAESELTAIALRVDARDVPPSVQTEQRMRLPQNTSRLPYRPTWAVSTPLPIERVTVRVETANGRVMQLTRLVPRAPAFSSATSRVQP